MLNEARKRKVDAKKAKFDEVEVPFRSKGNEEKGHGYSNFRNSTHKQNEGNRATSNLSRNDDKPTSQYMYLTSIEDLAMIQKVLTRTLDFNVTLTHRELLALASKLRKQVKKLTTIKRYSIGITALYDDIEANVIVM